MKSFLMMLYEFDIWTERKGKQTYTQRWPPPAPNYRHRQAFHGQRRFPHLAAGRLHKSFLTLTLTIWVVYFRLFDLNKTNKRLAFVGWFTLKCDLIL